MEAAASASAVVQFSFGHPRRSDSVLRSGSLAADGLNFVSFWPKLRFSTRDCKCFSQSKLWSRRTNFTKRRIPIVKASLSPGSEESASSIAPLQLESPIGQFLSQILISHPHLVPSAVEQQLELLQTERDAEEKKEESPATGTDLVLYRRIAEVKANDRKKALEEILYALVVQKFMDADVTLVPAISPSAPDSSNRVDLWPSQEKKLEQLHSPEAYEMIQNHLALILGNRLGESTSIAQISKLRVGQVYAASVMYGYFLRRVDQRFQLEKSMKILPGASNEEEGDIQQALVDDTRPNVGQSSFSTASSHPEVPTGSVQIKPSRLRTYVMSFDGETLQRYATIRSKEAISIVEKHTEALFGRPEIVITPEGTVDSSKDELINISFSGLKMLVLEAVTFGSFLWVMGCRELRGFQIPFCHELS